MTYNFAYVLTTDVPTDEKEQKLELVVIFLGESSFFKTPIMTTKIFFKLITFNWPERGQNAVVKTKALFLYLHPEKGIY